MKISLSAGTKSRTEGSVQLSAEGERLPNVRLYFRLKTKPKPKVDHTKTEKQYIVEIAHQCTITAVTRNSFISLRRSRSAGHGHLVLVRMTMNQCV